jgi:hypothetical protein
MICQEEEKLNRQGNYVPRHALVYCWNLAAPRKKEESLVVLHGIIWTRT